MIDRKVKSYHYRRAKFAVSENANLQALVEAALKALELAVDRLQTVKQSLTDDAPVDKFVICRSQTIRNALCCEFVTYAPGSGRESIDADPSAKEFEPVPVQAPLGKDGRRGEFLDASMYFCVSDNHAVICQATSLRAPRLISHLNWLLRKSGVITGEEAIELDPYFDPDFDGTWKSGEISMISMGRPLLDRGEAPSDLPNTATALIEGEPWAALQAFMPAVCRSITENMTLETALERESIEMRVGIKIGASEAAQKFGRKLAVVAYDGASDLSEFKVTLRNGTTIGAGNFVKKDKSYVTHNTGIPVRSELYEAMIDKLSIWLMPE